MINVNKFRKNELRELIIRAIQQGQEAWIQMEGDSFTVFNCKFWSTLAKHNVYCASVEAQIYFPRKSATKEELVNLWNDLRTLDKEWDFIRTLWLSDAPTKRKIVVQK